MTKPSFQQLIDDGTKLLFDHSDTPRIDSEVLLQHALQKNLAWLIAHSNEYATAEQLKAFYALIAERAEGQPIAYLVGYKEFWSLKLKVNQHVLIPRGDTETLVELALEHLPKQQASTVLDLGTGSGAIALSIAKERPNSSVVAVDAHSNALEVAKHNQQLHKLENVELLVSNWFDSVPSNEFDMIVSNPPYVAAKDPHLEQGDLRFEPDTALIATNNGFDDLHHIIEQAPNHLKHDGYLIVEHGFEQAEQVATAFEHRGFSNAVTHNDINQLPRCSIGQWSCQK